MNRKSNCLPPNPIREQPETLSNIENGRPDVVAVECYSGYAYAERPVTFVWRGRRYQIEQILKRWRSPEGPGFWVLASGDVRFELIYSEANDEWALRLLADSPPRKEKDNDA